MNQPNKVLIIAWMLVFHGLTSHTAVSMWKMPGWGDGLPVWFHSFEQYPYVIIPQNDFVQNAMPDTVFSCKGSHKSIDSSRDSNVLNKLEKKRGAFSVKNGMAMIDIQALYKDSMRYNPSDSFHVPSQEELERFSRIFQQCIHLHETGETPRLAQLNLLANTLGFEVLQLTEKEGSIITVIREKDGIRGGRGFYALARSQPLTRPTVIQTPHALSDAHTGPLGLATFLETTSSAYFSSTMRRSAPSTPLSPDSGECDDSELDTGEVKHDDADAAHSPDHYYTTATQSYARVHPDSLVIQLHGFVSDAKDPSKDFDAIISSGREVDRRPSVEERLIKLFQSALKSKRIGVYGQDTHAYGALSNLQGQFIHSTCGVFFHIELAQHYRKALIRSKIERTDLIVSIQRVISDYETYQNQ